MKVKPIFAWYDFWIGLFWDQKKKVLYFFPIPMLGLVFDFKKIEKPIECYEIHTVQARMYGCKTQCVECALQEAKNKFPKV